VLDRGYVMRDESGTPVRMIGGMTDITDRKQIEDRLRTLAAALDAAGDPIIITDTQGRIEWVNQAFTATTGYSAEEALHRNPGELFKSGVHGEAFYRHLWETITAGKVWQGEMTNRFRDGTLHPEAVTITPVRNPVGAIEHFVAIKRDLTETKKREQLAMRAQRLESIGTLAGGMAHDLNNVLTPIMLAVEMLRGEIERPQAREMLDTVADSATQGAALIRQMLAFARGEPGERRRLDVRHIVKDVIQVARETFPKNIVVTEAVPRELWSVNADSTQLHQVLMNLCVNARDAMPEGGRLQLSAENTVLDDVYAGLNPQARSGSYVLIKVVDDGIGIPAEIQERIFEPFFTSKEIGQGTGLGLSVTYSIVQNHEGFLNVYSEEGKGTTFKIYLPAFADADAQAATAVRQAGLPQGDGECVLVVDDESNVREVAAKTLRRHGYRVELAEDGAEAVSVYARRQDEIDVVLTDMSMPVMDGPATIIALKRIDPDVKIIASSGLAGNGNVAKVAHQNVTEFIPKPYTAAALLHALARVLHEA